MREQNALSDTGICCKEIISIFPNEVNLNLLLFFFLFGCCVLATLFIENVAHFKHTGELARKPEVCVFWFGVVIRLSICCSCFEHHWCRFEAKVVHVLLFSGNDRGMFWKWWLYCWDEIGQILFFDLCPQKQMWIEMAALSFSKKDQKICSFLLC